MNIILIIIMNMYIILLLNAMTSHYNGWLWSSLPPGGYWPKIRVNGRVNGKQYTK